MAQPPIHWNANDEGNSIPAVNFSDLNVYAKELVPAIIPKLPSAEQINTEMEQKYARSTTAPTTTAETLNETTKSNTSAVSKGKKAIAAVKGDTERQKEPLNILFCGHVDAGKSTIAGHLLFLTGQIDQRTLEKHQVEARENSRESWMHAFAMDTTKEERAHGITVEVGRAWFETERKHIVILDAPGHRHFVPNMIVGAAQADVAVLVVSARRGEFETGFERGGQTREHTMLVKAAGVRHMIVLINKMDDSTVNWDRDRYDEIKNKLIPYLKKCGFKSDEDITFIPCSGMKGAFLKKAPEEQCAPWYTGSTFAEYLDSLPPFNRNIDGPFRMPIVEKYKDMGMIVMGKIESGCCRVGDQCVIMPNRNRVKVTNIYYEDMETDFCICGENVRLKLANIDEDKISSGSVLCSTESEPCHVGKIVVVEHKSFISPGYSAVLHIYGASFEVQLQKLIVLVDRKTGERTQPNPRYIKQDHAAIARFQLSQSGKGICMELFKNFAPLGRFTLREENGTVAVGKILAIVE
ncbi:unnamed protein product [Adineta ricciae]|uniref:Tr-type G domain-containing protein n=1 Tax=Adineta ricciae TaxID=249248 RepID=A0A815MWT0_ADIRI|nr:unnamed protein product [Adineta ricciae]CAF1423966.1 unnamed protein product [Adineta ricciae]